MSEEQKNRQDEQEQPAASAPPTAAADAQTAGPGTTAAADAQPAEQNTQAADEPSPIRCTAVLDGKMQARIGRENRSTGILFAVLGAAALAFGILFLTLPALGGEDASFFGWLLLTAIPLVGLAVSIYVTPYIETTRAGFYLAVTGLDSRRDEGGRYGHEYERQRRYEEQYRDRDGRDPWDD